MTHTNMHINMYTEYIFMRIIHLNFLSICEMFKVWTWHSPHGPSWSHVLAYLRVSEGDNLEKAKSTGSRAGGT